MENNLTNFIDPAFDGAAFQTYQGYSLQAFSSGRLKLSFHVSPLQRHEYYAVCPKRDREAYRRQRSRSATTIPTHFDRVDALLDQGSWDKVFRVHLKGNPNETADNAHILASWARRTVVLLLGELEHEWELPLLVVHALQAADGPRKGAASIFHEYMAVYEHDWAPATFTAADHKQGYRDPSKRNHEQGGLDVF